jgi:hypothetical protein
MTTASLPTGSTTRTFAVDALRVLLDDALSVAASDDTDRLSGDTAAGRALLSLAALARQAAGRLGADAGTSLTTGPGVVVVRDLAAAVRLLDRTTDGGTAAEDFDPVLAQAQGLRAQLLEESGRR